MNAHQRRIQRRAKARTWQRLNAVAAKAVVGMRQFHEAVRYAELAQQAYLAALRDAEMASSG